MKKVLDIYRIDWRRISRSKGAILLIAALMLLPSLYAWFNIKALWDPYGNTTGIKIAVANDDAGTNLEDYTINVGEELVNKLKGNKSLGWTFVSKNKADKGVLYGDYYASLYIPKDFSENLSSILSGEHEKAEIIFTVNDKINAITPKITTTGATMITNQISSQFVDTVSQALLTVFENIGIELEKDLPTIRKLENKLYEIEDALPKINEFGQKVIALEEHLPEFEEKVNKLISLTDYIPAIDEAGQKVLQIQENIPKLEQVGEKVELLQGKTTDIRLAADQLNNFMDNYNSFEETLQSVIAQAENASEVIASVQNQLPKLEQLSENSEGYIQTVNDFVNKLELAFDTIAKAVKLNMTIVKNMADTTVTVAEQMKQLSNSGVPLSNSKNQISQLLSQQSTLINIQLRHIDSLLNQGVTSPILENLLTKTQKLQTSVNDFSKNINNSSTTDVYNSAVNIDQQVSSILNDYDNTYLPAIETVLENIQSDIATAEDTLHEMQIQLPNVSDVLTSTGEIVQKAIESLQSFQENLPQMEERLQNANNIINDNLDSVITGINEATDFYTNQFPAVKDKMNKASDFVKNDLPGIEEKMQNTAQLVEEKMPKLMEAVELADDLAKNSLPKLTTAVGNTTEKLNEAKASISVEDLISLLRRDVESDSDFLSNPIKLVEEKKFPIANYGSASSPFYTALAIWVGGLLLVSMLSVNVEMPKGMYKPHHFYFGRGLTFLTIATVQAIVVALGNIFILRVDIHNKWSFILFSLIICFAFTTIVYTLVAIFGNIGKGIAIILLVLQISGSGGNFPIEVSPPFFQWINPFLPFTYAVNLLREGVGGVIWLNATKFISVLLIFSVLFIILGTILKKPLMNVVEQFTKNAKKSKIIH